PRHLPAIGAAYYQRRPRERSKISVAMNPSSGTPRFGRAHLSLSFRPERADAFSSRSLCANASACGAEESLFDRSVTTSPVAAASNFAPLWTTARRPAKYPVPNPTHMLAAISLAIWLYLFIANGNFWNLSLFDDDDTTHPTPKTWPTVTAIIPARNEAETIAQTIVALSHQSYPGKFSIIVVDDHS